MLGTEGGPLLRETEMSRDVGEGSSVKPWGSGSANNLVTVYVCMIWHSGTVKLSQGPQPTCFRNN